jgi:hypothetical protein
MVELLAPSVADLYQQLMPWLTVTPSAGEEQQHTTSSGSGPSPKPTDKPYSHTPPPPKKKKDGATPSPKQKKPSEPETPPPPPPRSTKVAHEYHKSPQKVTHEHPPAKNGYPAGVPPSPYDFDKLLAPDAFPNAEYFLTLHGFEFGPDYFVVPDNHNATIYANKLSFIDLNDSHDDQIAEVQSAFAIQFSSEHAKYRSEDGKYIEFPSGTYTIGVLKHPHYPHFWRVVSDTHRQSTRESDMEEVD